MKKQVLFVFLLTKTVFTYAQNVGIGVETPEKRLSVNGSIVVDYNGANRGGLDSAALLFGGKSSPVGISSSRNAFQSDNLGLSLWTKNEKRLTILDNGNIGIGTTDPQYRLHVDGNLYTHGTATFNSTAYFNGNTGLMQRVGIGGSANGSYRLTVLNGNSYFEENVFIGGATAGGERLFVNSSPGSPAARFMGGNVMINESAEIGNDLVAGNAYIGGAADPTYRVRIYGHTRVDQNLGVQGRLASGGLVDNNYQVRIYGNARIDDNFRVESNMGIGGAVDDNFRLRVYNGNSRFGGDVEVTGTLNAGNLDIDNLSIGGKGSVRSNGNSALKIHFFELNVDMNFTLSGQLEVVDFSLPDFENVADVRLSVSHFKPALEIGNNPDKLVTSFDTIDPVTNTAKFVLRSLTGTDFQIGGTYYIMAVMKDN